MSKFLVVLFFFKIDISQVTITCAGDVLRLLES